MSNGNEECSGSIGGHAEGAGSRQKVYSVSGRSAVSVGVYGQTAWYEGLFSLCYVMSYQG